MVSSVESLGGKGELALLVEARDWQSSSLGARAHWPRSLHTVLRLMLTSRYAMWMGWGPDLTFFYNDEYAAQTLGAKHPWALGRNAREVWAEIWDSVGPRIDHVLKTGEATWDEGLMLFLERNGYPEETYHTFSYSPAPGDAEGEIGGLFCVVIEETDRVLSGRRMAILHDLAARLSEVNATQAAIAAVEECLAGSSRDLPFALGYRLDDGFLVRTLKSGFAPSDEAALERVAVDERSWPFLSAFTRGVTTVVDLPPDLVWPKGAWKLSPKHALVVPMFDQGQGAPTGVFVAGLNPHRPLDDGYKSFVELFVGQFSAGLANAMAYENEKRRADELAAIDRAKTMFFSNVSHEFRTPLTLMLGPTEDALASPSRALEGEDLETVHRNELRLLKLVNALLDFARIESGRLAASYEPTDLASLTLGLASSFRSAIERAGLIFDVQCEATEPVYVDHDHWEKIVLNLLSNALKFTFEGSIKVRLQQRQDSVQLSIGDTGIGVDEAELPRLFERFHRIAGSRARTHEGSGIGLALVHELVRLNGGVVDVQSQVDQGTTFTVTLPLGNAHLPLDQIRHGSATRSNATSQAYVSEALRWLDTPAPIAHEQAEDDRYRILVVDDNADMRDYVARLLADRWQVQTVHDGEAALTEIRRQKPDLVITDVMMPKVDGLSLLRTLKDDPELHALPVIVLSARAGEEAASEGLEAGASDYIVKPFAGKDLLVRVASRLAAARAAQEANAIKENLYRHFMQAPFPVAVFRGPEHVVELANSATLRVWRRTESQAIGLPLLSVMPELEGQPFIKYLDGVLRTGIAYNGSAELARLPIPGTSVTEDIYFTFVYAPLLDPRGLPEGVLMSAFDVTSQVMSRDDMKKARDQAELAAAQLSDLSERLRAAQKVGRIGIFDWDIKKESVHWSPELYRLMGLEPGAIEPTPQAWTDKLFDESDRKTGWQALTDAVEKQLPTMEVEVRLRQPDNRARWVRLSTDIQYDSDRNPKRLLGAVVDVQLLKEAAEARAKALDEAERIGRAKDEFLATMSHELRTPLQAMLGWTRLLRGTPSDAKKLERGLEVIERNAEAQARLIEDLLDVSRIISGKLRLTIQKVAVSGVVYAAVDVVRQAAEAKGVRLVVNLDPDVGHIAADPDRLQQVIWNLLSNAVKFTPPGGAVGITARRHDSSLSICVEDTGAGIAAENLPLIFERFAQIDSTITRKHGGLGLGLAIVKHLAEAHGGVVTANSAGQGHGSCFTVTLPLRAVFLEREPAGSASEASPGGGSAKAGVDGRLVDVRLLIVDDDADSRELLRVVLEDEGARVSIADGAAKALALAGTNKFDVVVSDIGMPEMDGYSLNRALTAKGLAIPAVALTAYARAEDAEKARQAGFVQHLAKPVDVADLISVVARLVEGQRPLVK